MIADERPNGDWDQWLKVACPLAPRPSEMERRAA